LGGNVTTPSAPAVPQEPAQVQPAGTGAALAMPVSSIPANNTTLMPTAFLNMFMSINPFFVFSPCDQEKAITTPRMLSFQKQRLALV